MWNRKLWGVEMTSAMPEDKPKILGLAWQRINLPYYAGEPTRALLFQTRKDARAWCKAQHAKYLGRNDCCALWRFRTIRVVEIVRRVG